MQRITTDILLFMKECARSHRRIPNKSSYSGFMSIIYNVRHILHDDYDGIKKFISHTFIELQTMISIFIFCPSHFCE